MGGGGVLVILLLNHHASMLNMYTIYTGLVVTSDSNHYTLSSPLCQTHSESVLFTRRSVLHLRLGILKTQCCRALNHTKINSAYYLHCQ